MPESSMNGLENLATLIDQGPDTVRWLIHQGEVDRALGQAVWLKSAHHPEADRLVAEAWRAIRARRAVFALP